MQDYSASGSKERDTIMAEKQNAAPVEYASENLKNWFLESDEVHDVLFFRSPLSGGCEVAPQPASPVLDKLSFLESAFRNLWRMYSFQREYSCFLEGGYTEEQFREIEESLVSETDDMSDEKICAASKYVHDVLQGPILTDDLSDIVGVFECKLEEALREGGFNLKREWE